ALELRTISPWNLYYTSLLFLLLAFSISLPMVSKMFLSFFSLVFMGFLVSSQAYDFYVGGKDGWVVKPSESFSHWAERNRFQVNDTLVFKYKNGTDSVLVVNKQDFDQCSTSNPVSKMDDGNSKYKFDKQGPFYFISGNLTNCQNGQKLIVVVLTPRNKSPPAPSSQGTPPQASPGTPPQASPPQGTPPQATPGSPPQASPPQGTPPQASPGTPPQASPPQGTPQASPPQGNPPQASPPQGTPQASPPQGSPAQGTPPQASPPQQGTPAQGTPPQATPPSGDTPSTGGTPDGQGPSQPASTPPNNKNSSPAITTSCGFTLGFPLVVSMILGSFVGSI
ncbi:hypothetical protein IFM89_023378, partial [Coptis chinensis]